MSILEMVEPVIVVLTPLYLLSYSLSFLPRTLFDLVTTRPADLTSWSKVKAAWFARFWTAFGPGSTERALPVVEPLLHQHASGRVLDIGSGQGHFLKLYPAKQITKIYAIEPNRDHHQQLLANAKAANLLEGNKFEIVEAFIETLSTAGIERGSIDTICTLQTLCSIPNPQVLIPELRTYLKKGGKWIVYEHVRRPERNGIIALFQKILDVVWPECFNGCRLTRRTRDWIEATGGWQELTENVEDKLQPLPSDSEYAVLPTVSGVLVSQ